ncbi:MAG TPA: methyltransferase domain-containing protein [Gammaproteobacteria bacterium]
MARESGFATDKKVVKAEFLDTGQYTDESISKYERVYGRDFVSPGGIDTAREFIQRLDLRSGMRVLDAGCGLGGAAFLMAQEFGASVTGVDLSANMIRRADARCRSLGLGDRVSFSREDVVKLDFSNEFDVVHSRDVFLHITDKPTLFATLHRTLKPGGCLLVTDYCRGDRKSSKEFERYVTERGYDLLDLDGYAARIRQAGFYNVVAEDLTEQFIAIHHRELDGLVNKDHGETDLTELIVGWRDKIQRAHRGEQRWGLFSALKR